MGPQPNIASAAFLIADSARAAILMSLLDGRARPAGELAFAAGVTAQTASSHLGKLLTGGLLVVERDGRHRYYRLAGPQVALALENLASISPVEMVRRKPPSREAQSLEFARCCYDHLAGRVSVAVTKVLQERRFLVAAGDKQFDVTPAGVEWFGCVGLDVAKLRRGRRGLARRCLDWSEREHHLAGPLGAQFMNLLRANDWLRLSKSSRAIQITPKGWAGLKAQLDIDEKSIAHGAWALNQHRAIWAV
jgi:DNA-binding transcriptional ArsR family regulator